MFQIILCREVKVNRGQVRVIALVILMMVIVSIVVAVSPLLLCILESDIPDLDLTQHSPLFVRSRADLPNKRNRASYLEAGDSQ